MPDFLSTLQKIINDLLSGKSVSFKLSSNSTSNEDDVTLSAQTETDDPVPIPPPPPTPLPVPPIPPVVPVPVSPPQFNVINHPISIPSILKTPYPHGTNAWYQNIVVGTNCIVPEPYQIKVVENGLVVCYPAQAFTQDNLHITTQFLQNASIEFSENVGTFAVTKVDNLTLTLNWTSATGQGAKSVIAQGCPYISMEYANTSPLFTTEHAILSINNFTAQGVYTGNKFKILLNNGQTWVLYCSSSIAFNWINTGQLKAVTPFIGIVRLSVLAAVSDETILDQYVTCVPVGGSVSVAYSDTIDYTFTWSVVGQGPLLMCALPHQIDALQSPQTVSTSWKSIKGQTIGVVGSQWKLREQMPKIQWLAPRSIDTSQLQGIISQLKKDASFINSNTSDTYFSGKGLAKMARLLLIAEEVSDTESVSLLQNNLKTSLNTWFSNNLFAYDQTWGGIVFAPALTDRGADFGFSYSYNDHHFHLGYFVYACAVLAKVDYLWMTAYKERVTELVHDYCNPIGSNDTRYPEIRNKDIYTGHSWAAGLFDFADNRNQESTSEAINAYYAAMLWGLVTGDTDSQNFSSFMLMTEIRSAKKYWHTYPGNNVYGDKWSSAGVGIIWSSKIDDATWFDNHLSCRRGIQAIPITPITELYLEPTWIQAMNKTELLQMINENFTIWPTFVYSMQAVIDKVAALKSISALSSNQIDDGSSLTNLLWWIATRP